MDYMRSHAIIYKMDRKYTLTRTDCSIDCDCFIAPKSFSCLVNRRRPWSDIRSFGARSCSFNQRHFWEVSNSARLLADHLADLIDGKLSGPGPSFRKGFRWRSDWNTLIAQVRRCFWFSFGRSNAVKRALAGKSQKCLAFGCFANKQYYKAQ